MLVPSCLPALLLDSLFHHVPQLGAVKERACVLEDVLGAVVKYLPHEEPHEAAYLRVLTEVPLVLDSELQLFLVDFVFLCADDPLDAD